LDDAPRGATVLCPGVAYQVNRAGQTVTVFPHTPIFDEPEDKNRVLSLGIDDLKSIISLMK
jgi:hypothetical protein